MVFYCTSGQSYKIIAVLPRWDTLYPWLLYRPGIYSLMSHNFNSWIHTFPWEINLNDQTCDSGCPSSFHTNYAFFKLQLLYCVMVLSLFHSPSRQSLLSIHLHAALKSIHILEKSSLQYFWQNYSNVCALTTFHSTKMKKTLLCPLLASIAVVSGRKRLLLSLSKNLLSHSHLEATQYNHSLLATEQLQQSGVIDSAWEAPQWR